jgi:hypothetical protein
MTRILLFKPSTKPSEALFWFAVGGESIPVTLDHLREGLVRFQTLPFQLSAPVLEELPRPGLAGVIPKLAEGLLQQVSSVPSQRIGRRLKPREVDVTCRLPSVMRLHAFTDETVALLG